MGNLPHAFLFLLVRHKKMGYNEHKGVADIIQISCAEKYKRWGVKKNEKDRFVDKRR